MSIKTNKILTFNNKDLKAKYKKAWTQNERIENIRQRKFVRFCPICSIDILYTNKYNYENAKNNKSTCKSCFDKLRTISIIDKIESKKKYYLENKVIIAEYKKAYRKATDTPAHVVNALSNLQPLWALDNISKGNRDI